MGREGVEPSTSRLSGVRSNHLSYRPNLLGRSGPRCRCLGGFAGEAAGGARRAGGAPSETQIGFTKNGLPVLVEPIGIEPMTY